MKLKRFLAAALAGVMAITSSVVTSVTASAEDAEYVIHPTGTSASVDSGLVLNGDVSAAIAAATTSVVVNFTGTQKEGSDWCQAYLQQDGGNYALSAATYSGSGSITINVATDKFTWYDNNGAANEITAAEALSAVTSFKVAGNNIDMTSVTVSVDGAAAVTAWSPSEIYCPPGGAAITISSSDFTTYGVTADNFADCSLKVTYKTAPASGACYIFPADWSQCYTGFNVTGTELTIPFNDSTISAAAETLLSKGMLFQFANGVITNITLTVPETKYAIETTAPTNGTLSVDKTEAAAGETVTVTATPATDYELDAITVNGNAITGTTFEMPAEDVTVAATFKAVESDEPTDEPTEDVLETGTYTDGKWSELSAEELAAAGTLNTITTVGDEYLTTANVLSIQYNTTEKKLRIYKVYKEEDLADKTSASIVVKKGNVGLKLTTECVYTQLASGQTAPEGCYYIAWVISGVDDPTEFSYSDITLA